MCCAAAAACFLRKILHPPEKKMKKREEKYKKYTLSYFFAVLCCFPFFLAREGKLLVSLCMWLANVWKIIATKIQLKMGCCVLRVGG